MKDDVKCPYCGEDQEINHDEGYGYEEDEIHEQCCRDCDQVFTYTTSIIYLYESAKCPCKNGGIHNLQPIHGFPVEFFVGKMRCSYCGDEVITDKVARDKAMAEYMKKKLRRRDCENQTLPK